MSKIGELKKELEQANTNLFDAEAALVAAQTTKNAAKQRVVNIKDQIKQSEVINKERTKEQASVTDHAALKYLERHWGLDVIALKNQIIESRGPMIDAIQSGKVKTPDGKVLVCSNGIVVTVA